jgi:hypothetical protein
LLFLLKKDPQKLQNVPPFNWLLLLLQNSEALSLQQFSTNLELLGKVNSHQNLYWNLFLLICNFEQILFFKFSLSERSSGRCLHIDSNTFVLLELMFFLFLKRPISQDFQESYLKKFQGT